MPEPSPYDVTGDGIVNILDLTFVASRFGESDSDADVTAMGLLTFWIWCVSRRIWVINLDDPVVTCPNPMFFLENL